MYRHVTYLRLHSQGIVQNGISSIAIIELPSKHKKIALEMKEGPTGVEVLVEGVNQVQIYPYAALQKYDVQPSLEAESHNTLSVLKSANA